MANLIDGINKHGYMWHSHTLNVHHICHFVIGIVQSITFSAVHLKKQFCYVSLRSKANFHPNNVHHSLSVIQINCLQLLLGSFVLSHYLSYITTLVEQ